MNLQPLRPGSLWEALQSEMLKDFPKPYRDLAALHNVRRRSGIKIKHHLGRTLNIFCQSQRRMQLECRQVRQPNQRRHVIRQNVVDSSPSATAPYGGGFYPVGLVHGRVLLEEGLAVYAVRISLAGQGAALEMWQDRGRDPHVIVNHVLLREAGGWIENLLQVGQLQFPALYFDDRRVWHVISAHTLCLKPQPAQNTGLFPNQGRPWALVGV